MRGEVRAIDIAPPDGSDALRPAEGAYAQFESTGSELTLQVVNYRSVGDAEEALKKMRQNTEDLNSTTRVNQNSESNKARKRIGGRLTVEGTKTGIDQVLWTDGSLLYVISGRGLATLVEFENNLPEAHVTSSEPLPVNPQRP